MENLPSPSDIWTHEFTKPRMRRQSFLEKVSVAHLLVLLLTDNNQALGRVLCIGVYCSLNLPHSPAM